MRDTAPRWSPDGTHLAFLAERKLKEKAQLYVMPAEDGEAIRITDFKNWVFAPAWSPDGTHLVFVSWVGGWQEPESEDEKQKSKPARVITTLKHKFNAEGFIHDRRPHLFVVPITGCEPRQITDGDCVDADPVWSPAGAWIAFTSARHADRDYDNVSFVWVMQPFG